MFSLIIDATFRSVIFVIQLILRYIIGLTYMFMYICMLTCYSLLFFSKTEMPKKRVAINGIMYSQNTLQEAVSKNKIKQRNGFQ